jgi:hypothetical protein
MNGPKARDEDPPTPQLPQHWLRPSDTEVIVDRRAHAAVPVWPNCPIVVLGWVDEVIESRDEKGHRGALSNYLRCPFFPGTQPPVHIEPSHRNRSRTIQVCSD